MRKLTNEKQLTDEKQELETYKNLEDFVKKILVFLIHEVKTQDLTNDPVFKPIKCI
jgi:hypothetical protein